mmetsp:Transcript_54483/g.100773  ORF Transcript_54483/g.100773 Transcript_54483/m.100773 type:complete len:433 (+) Transcript_54483:61-1359(+)
MGSDGEVRMESLKDVLLTEEEPISKDAKGDDNSMLSGGVTASTEDGPPDLETLGSDPDWSSQVSGVLPTPAQNIVKQDESGVELSGHGGEADAVRSAAQESLEQPSISEVAAQMDFPLRGSPLPIDVRQVEGDMLCEEEVVKLINWLLCALLGHAAVLENAWVTDYMALLSVAEAMGPTVDWLHRHLATRPGVVVFVVTCLAETPGFHGGVGHWVCFAVRSTSAALPPVVEVYDSQNHPDWYWEELNIKAKLVADAVFRLRAGSEAALTSYNLRLVDVKGEEIQRGGTDCGMHVALFVIGRVLLQQSQSSQLNCVVPNTPGSVRAFRSMLQELPQGDAAMRGSASSKDSPLLGQTSWLDLTRFQARLADAVNAAGAANGADRLFADEEAGLCCFGGAQDGVADRCSPSCWIGTLVAAFFLITIIVLYFALAF